MHEYTIPLWLLCAICAGLLSAVVYINWKPPLHKCGAALKQKKHRKKTDFKRNEIEGHGNNQAAGNVINHYYGSERHIGDLQQRVEDQKEIIRDQKEIINDFRTTIDRIYTEKEKLQEELDAIWNEYLTLRDEMASSRLPLLDLNKVFETKVA